MLGEIFFGQALPVASLDSLILHRKKIIRAIRRQKLFTSKKIHHHDNISKHIIPYLG